MKLTKMHWVGIIAGSLILVVNFLVYFLGSKNSNLLLFVSGIGVIILALPFIMGIVMRSNEEESVNERFLEFSRNLAESVAMGTPISKSIINVKNKDYGALSPYVQKLSNQIELGIPLNKAMQSFARDVDNPVVSRAVALISEAERAGGQIDYILESVAKSISDVEKLKKERKSAIYNLVVQGYIIFFIFIGIMLIMKFKILPITSEIGSIGGTGLGDISDIGIGGAGFSVKELSQPFLYLLVAQGFFAGLTIGKLAEGNIRAGIKHSFILMIVSFLISTGADVFVGA